ncbi:MAG: ketopantoate reductase family protein [Spirochaetes bacterium]|nr:ketopantoate reductase family protein [Spirochaetota bacterium]
MERIRRVVVLGAGAMGGFFLSRFLDAPGFEAAAAARGTRKKRLDTKGLVVNGKRYMGFALDPAEADSPADLIIVAVKNHHLQEAAGGLARLVSDRTVFLSVMNGLDSEEYLGSLYGDNKVLYGASVGIDSIREGNRVTFTHAGVHYFGEKKNRKPSPKVLLVQDAFRRAGISYETPLDMIRMLWWKFMINVGINQASAVMRAPYGIFQSLPEARSLMVSLMREVTALAKIVGVDLGEGDITDWYKVLEKLAPHGKTSMLQDVEAGRKTEVEAFGGKVTSLGKEHDVPTPVNRAVTSIIHVLERDADRTDPFNRADTGDG